MKNVVPLFVFLTTLNDSSTHGFLQTHLLHKMFVSGILSLLFLTSVLMMRKRRKEKETADLIAKFEEELDFLIFGPMTKLWTGLVTHHKDVFVSHVIPKMNETDRFFFSRATRESRSVLAYAGVNASGLRWYVHECSSISTLEWAWNNFTWGEKLNDGRVIDQAWFCAEVAASNKLEFLKWAREEKKCEWDERTINEAALEGNLEMLKYCFANDCPRYESELVCEATLWFKATTKGHLDCLRFLCDEMKPSREMANQLASEAAGCGHLDLLKYIVDETNISGHKEVLPLITCAANNAHLHCLDYLLEDREEPLNLPLGWLPLAGARYKEQTESTRYLREEGFPETTDMQYSFYIDHMVPRHVKNVK